MTAHSELGASNAHRWMNCTASVAEEAKWPNESNDAADRGTVNHYVLELCLRRNMAPRNFIGSKFVIIDGDAIGLDQAPAGAKYDKVWDFEQEDADAVQVGVDAVAEVFDSMTEEERESAELILEEKLDLSSIDPRMFGTGDILILIPFVKFWMLDYKNGSGLVEVEDNAQVLYYSLGVYLNHGTPEGVGGIIQPNAYHKDGPVRTIDVTEGELDTFAEALSHAAYRVDNDPTFKVGPWCHFCRADKNNACPEKMRADHNEALDHLVDLDALPAEAKPQLMLPAVDAMTDEQLSALLDNASKITNWVAKAKTEALQRAQLGAEIPGYVVGEGRKGNREWSENIEGGLHKIAEELGMERGEFFTLMTPSAIEKKVGKKAYAKFFSEKVIQKPGKPALVEDKDAEGGSGDPLALLSINSDAGEKE